MKLRRVFTLVIILTALMSLSATAALAQDPDNGKVLWEEEIWQCQQCHGAEGEGAWSRPLSNSEKTAEEWIEQVRSPRRSMPSFAEAQISDQQITDIHAYITSLDTAPEDFSPQDPGTAENEGQNLMLQKRCVSCHQNEAENGEGRMISNFVDQGVVPDAETVITQLRNPANLMPSYTEEQVSDEEAALIADYLAQQVQEAQGSTAQTDEAQQAQAPESLPQSGGDHSWILSFSLILLAIGGSFIVVGGYLRRTIH